MQPHGKPQLCDLPEPNIEGIACMRNVVFLQLEALKFYFEFLFVTRKAVTLNVFAPQKNQATVTTGPLSRTLKPFIYLRLRDAEFISAQSLDEDIVSSMKLLKVVFQGLVNLVFIIGISLPHITDPS
jgi:hypothetical protein